MTETTEALRGRAARALWGLDDELVFLNHGSFGAVPLAMLERAAQVRRAIERNPVEAIWRAGMVELRASAERVAAFLGSDPERTGFVTNATAGLNAVLASLALEPGDELLHLDQGYNAIWQTLRVLARRRGVAIRKLELPLPVRAPAQITAAVLAAIGPATRVLVIDQITSPTALVLPVADIVAGAEARGVLVVIDGAHAPGMLERPAAEAPRAAAWTGNLHKWPCALRGCAALTVREDLADTVHAPIISHNLDMGLAAELDWQGTIDPTPWLLAGESIAFMDRLGGWPAVRAHNHDLATRMHAMLCARLELEPLSPLDGSMLGSMASMRVPEALQPREGDGGAEALQARLLAEHRVEIPMWDFAGVRYTRISCHVYNEDADYARLAEGLEALARA